MGMTMIEKILAAHGNRKTVKPYDIVDVRIDARIARDFGGANVVKNLEQSGLGVDNPNCTFFTFDCNPTGSDQKYAANQQYCREFARKNGIKVHDIDAGVGTHIAIDEGIIGPGGTLVSTDSHANILGAVGAFGQGMGDVDIAHAFARGMVWFQVPPSLKIKFQGTPSPSATPKDLTLALIRETGANGLLGYAAEIVGGAIDALDLSGRITMASMATEMGGVIAMIPPNDYVNEHCRNAGSNFFPVYADINAKYEKVIKIDVEGLEPLIARPGHPEDVVPVSAEEGKPVDSVFIGSCTNGRFEDIAAAAEVLSNRRTAQGLVLKVVPSTDAVWKRCLDEGILDTLKAAGALVGNAGCAGCASGQIGQNGPGEVTVSTGNRNFVGKQGKGQVYLASPRTAAATAIAGAIVSAENLDSMLANGGKRERPVELATSKSPKPAAVESDKPEEKPTKIEGRVWVIERDNIDTDMIYHNSHLTVTDINEMGQYAFGALEGYEDFARKAKPGDIVITGKNFGCGSSRQQAVDCFRSLGVTIIIAESFGSIYERNAINGAMPIMAADRLSADLKTGDKIKINLETGKIELPNGSAVKGHPFSEVQMEIYKRGGLLAGARG